jgi:hypothetical protein
MELRADLNVTELHEPDDFGAFKVVAPAHVWISPEEIERLAGERAQDPSWRQGFERMLAYAREHGWVDERGFVRAHVEPAPVST